MVLIAYHLLEGSTYAYLGWIVNEIMMTANKIEYKDARLVMPLADAINPQARLPCIFLGVFSFLLTDKSCRVQLSTQGLFYPIAGDRNMWSWHLCVETS